MIKNTLPLLTTKGVTTLFVGNAQTDIPYVFYTAEVIRAIEHIVSTQDKEVAWVGLVEKLKDSNYLVYKLYIPNQTVTSTSVDIEPDAMANLVMQILNENHNPEHLRYHGHSHVNMAVFPSSTDQQHIVDYLEHADFFIREIRNKNDKYRVDIFDKEQNKIYHCVDTDIYELLQDDEFYLKIDSQLEKQIKKKIYPTSKVDKTSRFFKDVNEHIKQEKFNNLNIVDYDTLLADPFYVSGS